MLLFPCLGGDLLTHCHMDIFGVIVKDVIVLSMISSAFSPDAGGATLIKLTLDRIDDPAAPPNPESQSWQERQSYIEKM